MYSGILIFEPSSLKNHRVQEIGGKLTVFDRKRPDTTSIATSGSSYWEVRKNEGLRKRAFTVLLCYVISVMEYMSCFTLILISIFDLSKKYIGKK